MNNITFLLKEAARYAGKVQAARNSTTRYAAAFELGIIAEELKNEITGGMSQAGFLSTQI